MKHQRLIIYSAEHAAALLKAGDLNADQTAAAEAIVLGGIVVTQECGLGPSTIIEAPKQVASITNELKRISGGAGVVCEESPDSDLVHFHRAGVCSVLADESLFLGALLSLDDNATFGDIRAAIEERLNPNARRAYV